MFKWLMLSIYIMLIAYVLWRGIHCLKGSSPYLGKKRVWVPLAMIMVIACASLIIGGLMPHDHLGSLVRNCSNYILSVFIYLVFFIVLIDLAVLLMKLLCKKKLDYLNRRGAYRTLVLVTIGLSLGLTTYGHFHAKEIKIHSYEADIPKDGGKLTELNVVLISDLHLGHSVGCDMMEDMVKKINALHPDIILLAGDIVDNSYQALDDPEKLQEILRGLQSKYGTYGVYGNHDVNALLIGGFSVTPKNQQFRDQRVVSFLEKCGITMLSDEHKLIDDSFYLLGRVDGEITGDGSFQRKCPAELTKGLDSAKPCLMISHEPDELKEDEEAGVDVLFSGHTHAGQFFPLTLMCLKWENAWGQSKIGNMNLFVSSGIGVYGPDIRVGTDSEIMNIRLHFP